MKVLIVSREYPPSSEGGISRRLSNIVPRLIDRGIEVGVVCFGGSSLAGERVYALNPRSRILYTHWGEPFLIDAPLVLTDIWRLDRYASEILSSGNYDVVQVEEPVFGPFISSSVPRIVTTHTTQLGEFGALLGVLNSTRQITRLAFSGTVGWAFDRLCLGGADVVVPVGETVKAELRRLYGVRDEKLQVVPNAVNVPKEVRKDEAKKEIGIDNLLFLYAGRLIDRKRVEDFVSAIGMLRRRGLQDFSALVVGSGPIKEALENLACRLNLEGCLRFTGYVPDHRFFRILEAADVFVLPSCYEGHPISVLEAMAYGCVPVVSNISQSREIVKTGRNGVTYPLGDLESLTEALLNLASDDELRASFSLSARRSAMDLPWSAVANQYVQIYNALVP